MTAVPSASVVAEGRPGAGLGGRSGEEAAAVVGIEQGEDAAEQGSSPRQAARRKTSRSAGSGRSKAASKSASSVIGGPPRGGSQRPDSPNARSAGRSHHGGGKILRTMNKRLTGQSTTEGTERKKKLWNPAFFLLYLSRLCPSVCPVVSSSYPFSAPAPRSRPSATPWRTPRPLGGGGGDAEGVGGLGDGQAGEIAELHQLGLPRVAGGEPVEGLVERDQVDVGPRRRRARRDRARSGRRSAPSFQGPASSRLLDQDAGASPRPRRRRSGRGRPRGGRGPGRRAASTPRGPGPSPGGSGPTASCRQSAIGELPQLVVDQRQEFSRRPRLAAGEGVEEPGDVVVLGGDRHGVISPSSLPFASAFHQSCERRSPSARRRRRGTSRSRPCRPKRPGIAPSRP